MSQMLRSLGAELFLYSPRKVNTVTGTVDGWLVQDGRFVQTTAAVPTVNGSWYIGRDQSRTPLVTAREFRKFADVNGVEIYPDRAFSSVLKDKMKTARLIREFDPSLHPRTEIYDHSEEQIRRYLQRYRTVFLKPRFGNKGNDIFSIERGKSGFRCAYYAERRKEEAWFDDLGHAFGRIDGGIDRKQYLIQQGIRIDRLNGVPFIMRVIMLDDGDQWQWVNKGVLAAPGSEIANTTQGGSNMKTTELFTNLYGDEKARELYSELKRTAFGFVRRLDTLFPGTLMEVAFDFVLNRNQQLKILEINTLPGMTKPGMRPEPALLNAFSPMPSEQEVYDRLVLPHGSHLARFLFAKLKARESRGLPLQVADPENVLTDTPPMLDQVATTLPDWSVDPDQSLIDQVAARQAQCLVAAYTATTSNRAHPRSPRRQREERRFGVLRQLESVCALDAWNDWQPSPTARAAMEHLAEDIKKCCLSPIPGKEHLLAIWSKSELNYLGRPDHVRLGWTALGLMALLKVERVAPGFTPLADLQALGEFLLWSQNSDGSLRSLFVPILGGWKEGWSSLDYPGEVAVALIMLHQLDPSPRWFHSALRIIQHLTASRESGTEFPTDYWALIAMSHLLKTRSPELTDGWRTRIVRHAEQLCTAILKQQIGPPIHPDLAGAFSADGDTETTANLLTGLQAAQDFLPQRESSLGEALDRAMERGVAFLIHACVPDNRHIQPMPRVIRARGEPTETDGSPAEPQTGERIRIGSVQSSLAVFAEQAKRTGR